MAGRVRLPKLRPGKWMADGRRHVPLQRVQGTRVGDRGTIFDKTRTPLTVWFSAAWLFATQKDGVSAQSLQRAPMYSPAWLSTSWHKYDHVTTLV